MRLSRPRLLLQLLSAAVEDEDPAAVIEDPEAEHLDAAVQELQDAEQLEATGTLLFFSRAPFFFSPPPEAPPTSRAAVVMSMKLNTGSGTLTQQTTKL